LVACLFSRFFVCDGIALRFRPVATWPVERDVEERKVAGRDEEEEESGRAIDNRPRIKTFILAADFSHTESVCTRFART